MDRTSSDRGIHVVHAGGGGTKHGWGRDHDVVSAPVVTGGHSSGLLPSAELEAAAQSLPGGVHNARHIVDALKELYLCKQATDRAALSIYTPGATFLDPLGQLNAVDAMLALAATFTPGPINDFSLIKVTPRERTMEVNIDMEYSLPIIHTNLPFKCVSLLTLNDEGKVVRHEDRWGGQPNLRWEDGMWGKLADVRRRLTGAGQAAIATLFK